MLTALSREDLIERRPADLGDDTVSQLVDVTDRPMVAGGIDAIAGLFGGALGALSIRRDQRPVLLDDPAMVPEANESVPIPARG